MNVLRLQLRSISNDLLILQRYAFVYGVHLLIVHVYTGLVRLVLYGISFFLICGSHSLHILRVLHLWLVLESPHRLLVFWVNLLQSLQLMKCLFSVHVVHVALKGIGDHLFIHAAESILGLLVVVLN